MKRLSATIALIVFCASFASPVAPGPLAAKSRTAKVPPKSHLAKARAAQPNPVPLPDRNPARAALATAASPDVPTGAATGAIPDQTQPSPAQPGTAALAATPADGNGAAVPSPDRNPVRPSVTPPLASQVPATPADTTALNIDFATILKPLLAYQLSASDMANLKELVPRESGRRRRWSPRGGGKSRTWQPASLPPGSTTGTATSMRPRRRSRASASPIPIGLAKTSSANAPKSLSSWAMQARTRSGPSSPICRAAYRRRQGRPRQRLFEGRQRAGSARARGLGLARLSAEFAGGEEDPGPLRLDADARRIIRPASTSCCFQTARPPPMRRCGPQSCFRRPSRRRSRRASP